MTRASRRAFSESSDRQRRRVGTTPPIVTIWRNAQEAHDGDVVRILQECSDVSSPRLAARREDE